MKKRLKTIPSFKNEDEERDFWAVADSSEYFDWDNAEPVVFPNLKPSSKTISLRIPQGLLDEIKVLSNKIDVPYQSMIKIWLADRVREESPTYDPNFKKKKTKK